MCSLSTPRYRWAFIPEASDDSGLEVRRQGTHQREFKPYVVRLAKLLRKRAKVLPFHRSLLRPGDLCNLKGPLGFRWGRSGV